MKIVSLGKNSGNLNFVAIDFETGMRRRESAVSVGLAYYDIPEPKLRCFCSLKSARKAWPDFKSHALPAHTGAYLYRCIKCIII
jgi:hypothetical protein